MTLRILAIDTTSEHGSLALVANGHLIEEAPVSSTDGFGHVLYPQVEALLSRHQWKPADIDCFAGASGPGSFTGIRVGLAAIKGLGKASGRPVVGISNLQAIAWHGSAPLRAAFVDARRGEVYGAVYSDSLGQVQPETVTTLQAWLETLPDGELEILSPDFARFRDVLGSGRTALIPRREAPRELAGAVGLIAAGRLASGQVLEPAVLDANYVRRSDAELFWREW